MKKLIFASLMFSSVAFATELEGHIAAMALRAEMPGGVYTGVCSLGPGIPDKSCEVTIEAFGDTFNGNFTNRETGEWLGTFWFNFDQGGFMHHDHVGDQDVFHWAMNYFPDIEGMVLTFTMDETVNPAIPLEFNYYSLSADETIFNIKLDVALPSPISRSKAFPTNDGNYLYKTSDGRSRKLSTHVSGLLGFHN